jgi:hypothetical protein
MSNNSAKWWLAVVMLCCLSPAASAKRWNPPPPPPPCRGRDCNWKTVPEGGSTAVYLFGTGLTCLGAMLLRSKTAKLTQS